MRKYKLRAQDYCNCEHAQMLREALEDVVWALTQPSGGAFDALTVAKHALDVDSEASEEHHSDR